MAEKEVAVSMVGNALILQLGVWIDGTLEDHGQPVAVLNTAPDVDLGRTIRHLLATRIRTRKKAEEGAAG